jgi:hypothetical protein
MTIRRSLPLLLPLLVLGVTARAQESVPPKDAVPATASVPATEDGAAIPYDLEVGFRTLRVSGNEAMYRTQIGERSGLLIRSFTLSAGELAGSSQFFDRLRIDASDLGAGPAGSLRIEADRRDRYRFRLVYRHANAFSALPAFANPLVGQGVVPGQHTVDRTDNALTADLQLLPGGSVTPFIGLSLHRFGGPGTTTYTLGGDEFRLSQQLEETEQEIRFGAGFNRGPLSGSFTQGWRRTRGAERLTLSSTDGAGNGNGPLLGQPIVATALTRDDRTRASTPFTTLFLTGRLGERTRLVGSYVRFAAESSGDLSESAAGSFASFALSRFFDGLSTTASSSAKNDTWRGGGRVEESLGAGIVAFAGYQKEHRELQGAALIESLYLQTLTFGGVDPRDVQVVLIAMSAMAREDDVASAGASLRAGGPFSARIEVRQATQTLSVAPDLAEIVVPGSQGGRFERRVLTLDTNASFTRAGFTLGGAYRHDQAGDPIFRTDFRNRDRLRLRGGWSAPKWIRAGINAEETSQSNDRPGIELAGTSRQYSGDVEVTPHEGIAFRGSLSRFRADNRIVIRHPENFDTEPSLYAEDGRSREGGVAVNLAPLSFDVSAARFLNRGANPFEIRRLRMRIGFDLPARMKSGLIAEYAADEYRESAAASGNFDATRIGLFIRYRP